MSGPLRPEDFLRHRLEDINPAGGPRTLMPSDVQMLVREMQFLKAEILKIRKALKDHGIEVPP